MNFTNIGLMILAAGASTRMGTPKQLLPYRDSTLIRHMAEAAIASVCQPIVIVLGANSEQIKPEISQLALQIVDNQQWAEGMSSSIRVGLATLNAINQNLEAVAIALCDQPFVSSQTLDRLVEAYRFTRKPIIASEYAGTLGVPVLFSRLLWPELVALKSTEGAKQLIQKYSHEVFKVPFPEGAIDIDTPKDYEEFQALTKR
ncbi:MAG TPA: 4-diphosphocytidyl-2C-methyl-D-erythritol synthase [Cyanobacteria bacterium UBA8803]|nr:4-diphosphocytidyl-2C-methyl-D-erythritol synthase [Cyanobacteria bacterium UBA9273]HBL57472.1 4-diphosphocytidyl-2C-methyl-D-erythritol synthase [Cyanobacteria bacterium UBA8803]